jgi:cell division FtsZ-interacting protein ZapD
MLSFTAESVAQCSELLDDLEAVQNKLVDTLRENPGSVEAAVRDALVAQVEALSPQIEQTRELLDQMRQKLAVERVQQKLAVEGATS